MGNLVRRRIETAKLASVVPPRFRGQVEALKLNDVTVSVVHLRDRVVRLREVRKVLGQVGQPGEELLLVLCEDLTEEARMALAEQRTLVIAQRSFGWTEQKYEEIKVFIGSRVKRPRS